MLGILVHGDNHFIVRGPMPDRACARALVKKWEFVSVLRLASGGSDQRFTAWTISTKEFREDLRWAIALEGERPMQPAVEQLLTELVLRGIPIHHAPGPLLPDVGGEWWVGHSVPD